MLALTRAPPSLRGRRSWLSRITAMTVIAPSSSYAASESFDVIVVGGGHAGCEAALTCARLGLSTALFALNLDRIAWQPCNPAVGGPAKSQLVHEVDALGGVIGRLADATALQKRILNASRGPAVWALRAQTDKRQYARQMLQLLQGLGQPLGGRLTGASRRQAAIAHPDAAAQEGAGGEDHGACGVDAAEVGAHSQHPA